MAEYVMESYAKQELDSSVAALADGLAIVSNGNTHAAIAKGQFVYVRNHGTLAEGLYKAPAAIAANASLTSSNLTADSTGGLNALNEQMANISSQIASLGSWTLYNTSSVGTNKYPTDKPFLIVVSKSGANYDSRVCHGNPSGNTMYFPTIASNCSLYFNGTGGFSASNLPSGYTVGIFTH